MRIHHHPGITLEQYAAQWVDMVPHLDTLTALASGCKSIVEFGVRGGVSTWALLRGLPKRGKLTSFDIDLDCRLMCPPLLFEDPRWTLRLENDVEAPMPPHADLVMIDSSHDYDHTLAELAIAAKMSPRYIVLHDYYDPDHPGVRRAVDEWVDGTPLRAGPYRILRVEESRWGLAILVPS